MAREEVRYVKVTCDITGEEEGAQGWEFELLGKKFGIDLVEREWDNLNVLIRQIAPYLEVAVDNSPGQAEIPIPAQGAKKPSGPDAADVRMWAAKNFPAGHEIDGKGMNEKGRVPKVWTDAYLAAQKAESEKPVVAPVPVTAQPDDQDDVDETFAASLPGRLEDDADRDVAK
ncbi:histone-like nucleoid-structuring protein Lsr2 [Streptomyces sp. NPDC056638]|uniref:Lsr2 dimerization domain-containing protein n=1 Tax=Streptomyces sp. NPDC056638 TaxID=3345887 RepID=UPI0036C4E526